MRRKACGIYLITNTVNGKVYVGSSVSIMDRWRWHRSSLRLGKHHSRMLQRAFNKHGEAAFEFTIIEECAQDTLHDRETAHMNQRESCNPSMGYNTLPIAGSPAGFKLSDETKQKMSESQRRIPYEKRLTYCCSFTGREHSEETKRRMAEAATGRYYSPETRAKIGAASKGRRHTPEMRAHMSAVRMGKEPSEETRAKLSAALKGRTFTPEWRAKLSEAQKRRHAKRQASQGRP